MKFKHRPGSRPRLRSFILPGIVFAAVFTGTLMDWSQPVAIGRTLVAQVRPAPPVDQHFRDCDAAHAAGRFDIPSSDPSYRSRMDGDDDGLACEPHW